MNAPAAPLVARLRAEIADLRQQLAVANEHHAKMEQLATPAEYVVEQNKFLRQGLAAAEEYKRDAERYRWLRDSTDAVCLTFSRETAETDCYSGSELDAAIDAARDEMSDRESLSDYDDPAPQGYTVTRQYFDNALQAAREGGARLAIWAGSRAIRDLHDGLNSGVTGIRNAALTEAMDAVNFLSIPKILKGKP